jgi:hypothetical protein
MTMKDKWGHVARASARLMLAGALVWALIDLTAYVAGWPIT